MLKNKRSIIIEIMTVWMKEEVNERVEDTEECSVYGQRLAKNKFREVQISHIMPFYSINKN